MPPAEGRPIAWGPMLVAMVLGAIIAGIVGWRLNLESLNRRVEEKRAALKKLQLSGRIPPNEEVMDYLATRQVSLQEQYQHWLKAVAAPPLAAAAKADPQLYFQERFHAVQQSVARLATARGITAPEQLGFPKELPPSDTVPRLLVQLTLIEEAAKLMFDQGVTTVSSLKVEDPETVLDEEGLGPFLMRLPVRIRFNGRLPHVMKVLGAVHRAEPLIDVRGLRIVPRSAAPPAAAADDETGGSIDGKPVTPPPPPPPSDQLDVELLLARYLVIAGMPDATEQQ